jgi:hypothetical protein
MKKIKLIDLDSTNTNLVKINNIECLGCYDKNIDTLYLDLQYSYLLENKNKRILNLLAKNDIKYSSKEQKEYEQTRVYIKNITKQFDYTE